MSEPIEPADAGDHVEDIDVEAVPEPDAPEEGVIDLGDDYTEGPDSDG